MGGRGSRSARPAGPPLWTLPLVGGGGPQPAAPPPNVQSGQPVPVVTQAQLQAMNDTEFANYLNGLKNTPIDPNTYYNNSWDTQRLIANMPELNMAPDVVDAQTFASLPGQELYRTVNRSGTDTAVDVCARSMASDVTTIGGGRMGDGFYFATDLHHSQTTYGNHRGDINGTATMTAKLNGNARVIKEDTLKSMLRKENTTVQSAVDSMDGGWFGGRSGLMAYALHKGYNVVDGGSYKNIIDRRAATWSQSVIPWT